MKEIQNLHNTECVWAKQVIDGLGQLFGDAETMQ
jgi:hypothetical protein